MASLDGTVKPRNVQRKLVSEIPAPFCDLFKHFENFNSVQSELLDDILHSDKSVVLGAPTGSGKTVVFELAMVKLLMHQQEQQQLDSYVGAKFKIVYVAPLKALCTEKFLDWKTRFSLLGISCLEVTGDSDLGDMTAIKAAHILVTTPEKWDSITRKWRDYHEVVNTVRLFMIDEVHLLNENIRGPILEAIVSRMKKISYSNMKSGKHLPPIRFVAASATIPNIQDLSLWLGGVNSVVQYCFGDEQRPVPLEKHIIGFNSKLQGFKFDMSLNYKLPEIIRKYCNRKPTLIFCSSRKSTEMASTVLQKEYSLFPRSDSQKISLAQLAQKLDDPKLRSLVLRGIAFHHAGLSYEDRNIIEENFRNGLLMILISTNTLAVGVNLPAHLVIIKSTETFTNGSLSEYSESALLQMIGRAGRPQYDVTGVAVIMTQSNNVHKYENLMKGRMPVESHLHKHLAEHLNSEIVLLTITDLEIAMEWIRSTFLYIRAVQCPANYGFSSTMNRAMVEKKLEEMCLIQINALHSYGLITKDDSCGLQVRATEYGKIMAKYYLSFETMKLFRQVRGTESYLQILNVIIQAKEFSDFTLRVNEKKPLNELNAFPVRFPIRGRIKKREDKISCLIQATFGNLHITEPSMIQDSLKMIRIGGRIINCLLEYIRLSESRLNDFNLGCYRALLHTVTIAKCFHSKLWENSEYASKQLRKVGMVYSTLLVNAGKTTLQLISDANPRILEKILNKQPPFGDEIIQNLQTFPEYSIDLKLKGSNLIQICVRQVNVKHVFDGCSAAIIVGDSCNNLLLFTENIDSVILEYGQFERTLKSNNPEVESIYANVVHSTLVGVDKTNTLVLKTPLPKPSNAGKSPKAQKRKYQSKLNISKTKISLNDSIVSSKDSTFDNSLNDFDLNSKCKAVDILKRKLNEPSHCRIATKDAIQNNLETFQFSKPILRSSLKKANHNASIIMGSDEDDNKKCDQTDENSLHDIFSISEDCNKNNDSISLISNDSINKTCSDHSFKQSKLTAYFSSRKSYRGKIHSGEPSCKVLSDAPHQKSSVEHEIIIGSDTSSENKNKLPLSTGSKTDNQLADIAFIEESLSSSSNSSRESTTANQPGAVVEMSLNKTSHSTQPTRFAITDLPLNMTNYDDKQSAVDTTLSNTTLSSRESDNEKQRAETVNDNVYTTVFDQPLDFSIVKGDSLMASCSKLNQTKVFVAPPKRQYTGTLNNCPSVPNSTIEIINNTSLHNPSTVSSATNATSISNFRARVSLQNFLGCNDTKPKATPSLKDKLSAPTFDIHKNSTAQRNSAQNPSQFNLKGLTQAIHKDAKKCTQNIFDYNNNMKPIRGKYNLDGIQTPKFRKEMSTDGSSWLSFHEVDSDPVDFYEANRDVVTTRSFLNNSLSRNLNHNSLRVTEREQLLLKTKIVEEKSSMFKALTLMEPSKSHDLINRNSNTEHIKRLYGLTKDFQKLQPENQTYQNFEKAYMTVIENENVIPCIRKNMPQQTEHKLQNRSQNAEANSSSVFKCATILSKNVFHRKLSQAAEQNPFRLQIFPSNYPLHNHTNNSGLRSSSSPNPQLNKSIVKKINSCLMTDILNRKCEQEVQSSGISRWQFNIEPDENGGEDEIDKLIKTVMDEPSLDVTSPVYGACFKYFEAHTTAPTRRTSLQFQIPQLDEPDFDKFLFDNGINPSDTSFDL